MKPTNHYAAIWRQVQEIDLEPRIEKSRLQRYGIVLREVFGHHVDCAAQAYRQTLFYQRLAYEQQMRPHEWLHTLSQDIPLGIQEKPTVILLAHLYSYRCTIRYLLQKGIKVALFVSSDVMQKQAQQFYDLAKDVPGILPHHLRLLDAEDPRVLIRARRAFEEGYSLVAYVDGNTGSKGKASIEQTNLARLDFGPMKIWVRVGMVRMAQWLACPLYTIWNTIDLDCRTQLILREWELLGDEQDVLQGIYTDLYRHISQHPPQWEGLLYFEGFLKRP